MEHTQEHFDAGPDGHVIVTGWARGHLTLNDGTIYDVSKPVVQIPPEHVDELAHLCGLQVEQLDLHPDHDANGKDGDYRVPFVYEAPKKFADYTPHADNGLEG